MKPCFIAGINVTWQCNSHCIHCFYRYFSELHTNVNRPLDDIKREIDDAKQRGCSGVVFIGYGEPLLYTHIEDAVRYCKDVNMSSNTITNGTLSIDRYKRLYDAGLNHLQVSVHAMGKALNAIMKNEVAWNKQYELLSWLSLEKKNFRTNTTLQQLNYKDLLLTSEYLYSLGSKHIALLNFLPHYHWNDKLLCSQVAVHPELLRPHLEDAMGYLESRSVMFTLRYFPFCHISPRYWKYITNARYVLFDPWEWDNGYYTPSVEALKPFAIAMGDSVKNEGYPCCACKMELHCGGWNVNYMNAFNGAELKAIEDIPDEYKDVAGTFGGIFDMNPANQHSGVF